MSTSVNAHLGFFYEDCSPREAACLIAGDCIPPKYADRLQAAGIEALFYTAGTDYGDGLQWRVLAPLAQLVALPPRWSSSEPLMQFWQSER